jgi:starch-binding outer membrane protein, SusD/RagB family
MKKYSLSFALAALVSVGAFTGCKKALDVQPTEQIDASIALTTKEGINAATNGLFSRLKSARLYGRDLIALPEVLADNGFATNRSGRLFPESNNQVRAHFTGETWDSCTGTSTRPT